MSSSPEDRDRTRLTRRALFRMTGGAAAFAALAVACQPTTTAPSASAAATSAPAASGAATAAPKAGGTAVISLGEPDTLGYGARSLTFAYIRSFIANAMVRLKYPDMTVVEDLATYTASSDGK